MQIDRFQKIFAMLNICSMSSFVLLFRSTDQVNYLEQTCIHDRICNKKITWLFMQFILILSLRIPFTYTDSLVDEVLDVTDCHSSISETGETSNRNVAEIKPIREKLEYNSLYKDTEESRPFCR